MAAKQSILLNNDKMSVNLDMYSSKARDGAVSALKNFCAPDGDSPADSTMAGLQGSFRKLEVD